MPKSYDYVRPKSAIGPRKRKSLLPQMLLILALILMAYFGYTNFQLKNEKKELALNTRIGNIFLSSSNSLEKAIIYAYEGPSAANNLNRSISLAEKNLKEIKNLLLREKNLKENQLRSLYNLILLNSNLKTFSGLPFSEANIKTLIPEIIEIFKETKESVLLLSLDDKIRKEIERKNIIFDTAKIFKPKEIQNYSNKRRGLGILSYSTKPRLLGKDERGYYYLEKTDLIDVNLEIQNQGEVSEKGIEILLTLESENAMEPLTFNRTVEEIKAREVKPVSFTAVPLQSIYGKLYKMVIMVKPVPGEKVLENNRLEINFYVKP